MRVVRCIAGGLVLLIGLGCETTPDDPEALLAASRQAVENNPADLNARYELGVAALAAGSHREALASFDRVLRADSSHAGSWSGTGQVLSLLGQEERAEAVFQRALDDVVAYRGLGLIALHQQRYAAARQSYSRAVELAPEHAPSRYNLGVAYSKKSAYEEAVRQMRRAIELDEEYVLPYVALGKIYCTKLGDCEEGVRLLRQALARAPDEPLLQTELGRAELQFGRADQAVAA